ncbi:MAG TPA: hypothetical protein VEZ70_03615 [Allosphingosinicella sp.]|nr:hypothetical protein [Allosphingosinicella sp.]
MSINSTPLSGRFRLREMVEGGKEIEASGELEADAQLKEFPARITLYGYRSEHLSLFPLFGTLIEVKFLGSEGGRSRSFVGRLHDEGWSTSAPPNQIDKMGSVVIQKAVDEFSREPEADEKHRCTYTYCVDVEGWPGRGGYGFSYDGTIELRKFRNGLNSLLRTRDINLEAVPHYIFTEDGRKTVRNKFASISAIWNTQDLDWKRYIDCARVVLSFTHVVKLRPLAMSRSGAGLYRRVSWDPRMIEESPKGARDGPVRISDQKSFHSKAIKKLFHSPHRIDYLDNIIDRYVECQTDVTLERSFAHGCEAIEGLYSLLLGSRATKPTVTADYSSLQRELKSIINKRVLDSDDRMVAASRVDQLFSRPTWHRVRDLINGLSNNEDDDLINRVVERSNFFRYRNRASHGQVVRLENEVVFQSHLMKFIIEWMFIKLCGGDVKPQSGAYIRGDLELDACPDVGLIQLWE